METGGDVNKDSRVEADDDARGRERLASSGAASATTTSSACDASSARCRVVRRTEPARSERLLSCSLRSESRVKRRPNCGRGGIGGGLKAKGRALGLGLVWRLA